MIRIINKGRMRWGEHVAWMSFDKKRILLGRLEHRLEAGSIIDLIETG
jgi:hypothetical protein